MLTLEERCKLATDCLPKAEYRTRLESLHAELLALRKNDERYRKWRADYTAASRNWPSECLTDMLLALADAWEEADVDAAIDAAPDLVLHNVGANLPP